MSSQRRKPTPQVRTGTPRGPALARGVTHEPEYPINWPDGHVGVELTPDDDDECIAVRVHSVTHYLHTTTAIELRRMLTEAIDAYDARVADVLAGGGPDAAALRLFQSLSDGTTTTT
jgi:hypothetical protein